MAAQPQGQHVEEAENDLGWAGQRALSMKKPGRAT